MDELPKSERETLSRVWKYDGGGRNSCYVLDGNGYTIAGPVTEAIAKALVRQHNSIVNQMIDDNLNDVLKAHGCKVVSAGVDDIES